MHIVAMTVLYIKKNKYIECILQCKCTSVLFNDFHVMQIINKLKIIFWSMTNYTSFSLHQVTVFVTTWSICSNIHNYACRLLFTVCSKSYFMTEDDIVTYTKTFYFIN